MKIVVIGAGAIGCYIGGRLASLQEDVWFIGRETLSKEIKLNGGITLIDIYQKKKFVESKSFHFVSSYQEMDMEDVDIVFVAVKSGDTESIAKELSTFQWKKKVIIISFQNGVSNPPKLRKYLPEVEVLHGIVGFNVVWTSNATFHNTSNNPLIIEYLEDPRIKKLADLMNQGGIRASLDKKIEEIAWTKLMINLNAATMALADKPMIQFLQDPILRQISSSCISEAITVVKAANIKYGYVGLISPGLMANALLLPNWIFLLLSRFFVKIDPKAKLSLHVDLSSGKKTEIDIYQGEIVKTAKKVGVPCPINEKIVELIKKAEMEGGSPKMKSKELLSQLGLKERRPYFVYFVIGLLVVYLWYRIFLR